MLKNASTLAIGGVDTEENEHCEVCPLSVYRSPRYFCALAMTVGLPEWAPKNSYEQGFAMCAAYRRLAISGRVIRNIFSYFIRESADAFFRFVFEKSASIGLINRL